jgi:phosphoadenosine phosphosulfate reductase
MWDLIVREGALPMRQSRFCCAELKERGGEGRLVITGIRSAEGQRRAKRGVLEACAKGNGKRFLHAIKHWTDNDVWNFIHEHGLPYPSLYDEGFKRIGCVLCPNDDPAKHLAHWPHICAQWRRSAHRAWPKMVARNSTVVTRFGTPDAWFDWWLDRDASMPDTDYQQCSMFGD